jgi:hypothetical protein
MDVWIVGVPVINRYPVKSGAKILFHVGQQFAGEGPDIGKFACVLGRNDEAEVMPVIGAALSERTPVNGTAAAAEQRGILPVPGDAIAPQICQVLGERRCGEAGAPVPHDPRFDDDTPLAGARGCAQTRYPPTRKATSPAPRSRTTCPATMARSVGESAKLGFKCALLALAGTAVPDAPWPDLEIVVAHGCGAKAMAAGSSHGGNA